MFLPRVIFAGVLGLKFFAGFWHLPVCRDALPSGLSLIHALGMVLRIRVLSFSLIIRSGLGDPVWV